MVTAFALLRVPVLAILDTTVLLASNVPPDIPDTQIVFHLAIQEIASTVPVLHLERVNVTSSGLDLLVILAILLLGIMERIVMFIVKRTPHVLVMELVIVMVCVAAITIFKERAAIYV